MSKTPEEKHGIDVGSYSDDFQDTGAPLEEEAHKVTDYDVNIESEFTFNAGEMYKGPSSAISELGSNAITSVLRAKRLFDAWDASVTFRIKEPRPGEVYLAVRDEGLGMSERLIDDVLAVIGETTGGAAEQANTRHGRGWFSTFQLVGREENDGEGTFYVSTNPRFDEDWDRDEPPHSVACSGRLYWLGEESWSLEEGEVGTKVWIPCRNGIEADDLEKWIRDFGRWSRVPILFERYYPDGTMENDELGGANIETLVSDDTPKVTIEKEGLYKAVASPDSSGKFIILDALIETQSEVSLCVPDANWNIDCRLLNEGGAIYESPDESKVGKNPVPESEYERKSQEEQEDSYIRRSEIGPEDKQLPTPSGTRDIITLDSDFVEHLQERATQKISDVVGNSVEQIEELPDIQNLSDKQARVVRNLLTNRTLLSFTPPNSEAAQKLRLTDRRVRVVDEGAQIENPRKVSNHIVERKMVFDVYREHDRVFMGNSVLQRRAEAVWKSDEDAAVVALPSPEYQKYERVGFENITNLTKTKVTDKLDGVPESVMEKFGRSYSSGSKSGDSPHGGVAEDYNEREVAIHTGRYNSSNSYKIGTIRTSFGDEFDGDEDYEQRSSLQNEGFRLVMVTSTSDHKISNVGPKVVNNRTGAASCVNKVYEETLAHLENVVKYDEEYDSHNADYNVTTSTGELTVSELKNCEEVNFVFVDTEVKNNLEHIDAETSIDIFSNLNPVGNGTSVFLTPNEIASFDNHRDEIPVGKNNMRLSVNNTYSREYSCERIENDTESVLSAIFPTADVTDNNVLSTMINTYSATILFEQAEDLVTFLAEQYDSTGELPENKSTPTVENDTSSLVVPTTEGAVSVEDLNKKSNHVVFFPVTEEVEEITGVPTPEEVMECGILFGRHGRYKNINLEVDDDAIVAVADIDTVQNILWDCPGTFGVGKVNTKTPGLGATRTKQRIARTMTQLYAVMELAEPERVANSGVSELFKTEIEDGGLEIVETLKEKEA